MEENTKITYTKNMNKFNFNSTLNIQIDNNANIKQMIDVNAYMFDQKIECGNGKAIVSGKIGVKVLYLDTDNMTNTVSDVQNFKETYLDNSLTSDTFLNISNHTITHNILSTEGVLKINCEVSITPIAYLNLLVPYNLQNTEKFITKKSELNTNYISNFVNTSFEFTSNLETRDSVSKILNLNCYFTPEKTTAQDGYAIVEGKMVTHLLYESMSDNETEIKELREISNVKCDVEIGDINENQTLDLSFTIDKSQEEISTEIEDNTSVVSVQNKINVTGVCLKPVTIDVIDDLYSVENDIETSTTKREYNKDIKNYSLSEVISNEFNLTTDEPAIDEVLSNLNITPEITNTYIKNDNLYLEGIVTSNLIYVDENKELKHKHTEIPFIIDTKIQTESIGCVHNSISVIDSKAKVKRGTIIEMEYSLFVHISMCEKETHDIIDNFTIGKQLDFSKYDFQIFIAKQNETMWELCKRIKISPDDIVKFNKDLPLIMNGGEKIIIKR